LFLFAFIFVWCFNKGADSRRTSDWLRDQEDDEQEKAMSELLQKKKAKKEGKEN